MSKGGIESANEYTFLLRGNENNLKLNIGDSCTTFSILEKVSELYTLKRRNIMVHEIMYQQSYF